MERWEEALDRRIAEIAPQLTEVRRHLHAHPEPSGEEFQTTAYLRRELEAFGLTAVPGPDSRGLMVDAEAAAAGAPRIALRADIDALWIQDLKACPYRSTRDGVMHACGHDGHSAVVLGALAGLEALRSGGLLPWPVAIRGVFQPAEETSVGARAMIAAGALEGVKAIFSMHMDPSRQAGRVGVRYGAFTAACDFVDLTICGRGGHAARPHESLDPIAAAAQLVQTLYLFVPRSTDSHHPVVLTIGQINAGHSPNVIPESAELHGTLRTLDSVVRAATKQRIRQLANGVAETTGAQINVAFEEGPPSVNNDRAMTDVASLAAMAVVGAHSVDNIERASMGGEDFAFYLERVPGSMFRLGCSPTASGSPSLHSPLFDIDERAIAIGARILARAAVIAADPARAGGDAGWDRGERENGAPVEGKRGG